MPLLQGHPPMNAALSCDPPHLQMAYSSSRRKAIQTLSVFPFTFLLPARSEVSEPLLFTKLPCPNSNYRDVEIHDYREGQGPTVERGTTLVFRWTGRLADRYGWPIQKEDADPVTIVFGKDRLIRGFEMGLAGMREGGKRRMLIPAELGYLDERSLPLPAAYGDRRRLFATVLNSRRIKKAGDLVIDVQLMRVKPSR